MRLSKLTLSGFKSFADRTEFTFDEPMIGVVGPNGCGKSNIVDAVKWVLGERSSKSLRGKEMIDVIFAGSAARKPSGLASVKLTFENPIINHAQTAGQTTAQTTDAPSEKPVDESSDDHHQTEDPLDEPSEASTILTARGKSGRGLPVDTDTVEVERRLYRDGKSEYLINNKRARLKDIRDLFLDTGVGADAYSIIEQGKVDAMLLASPQERRTIFEEAAGIARYKQRRIESQRKLQRAEANLALTREQLASTERRLRIVKGQAAKARKFVAIDAELKALRMAVAFDRYEDLRQRLDGLTSRLADLDTHRADAVAKLEQAEANKQEGELRRHDLQTRHRRLEEERTGAQHAAESAAQRRELTQRAAEEARRQTESDRKRLTEESGKLGEIVQEIERHESEIAALAESLADADRRLDELTAERTKALETVAEHRSTLSEHRAAARNIERERGTILSSIHADEKRSEAFREQIESIEAKAQRAATELETLTTSINEQLRSVEDRAIDIKTLENNLARHTEGLSALTEDRGELASRVSELEQEHLRLDSRRQTLHELLESRAALGDAVRSVMQQRESGERFTGVIAPLAELIRTDAEHAPFVEAALGANLQALIVETPADEPPQDEIGELEGRVTFIPLSEVRPAPVDHIPVHGAIPLRGFVTAQGPHAESIERLLEKLLGAAHLVDDLDTAQRMSAELRRKHGRFAPMLVTRAGEVVTRDGALIAGPAGDGAEGAAAGILQRQSERTDLEARLESLSADLSRERSALQAIDAEAAERSTQAAAMRGELATLQRALVTDQSALERMQSERNRAQRDTTALAEDKSQLEQRLAKIGEDREHLEERSQRLQRLLDEQTHTCEQAERDIAEAESTAASAGEQMTAAKVESSRISEQLQSARREHSRLEIDRDERQRAIRDISQHLERLEARAEQHTEAIAEAEREIEQATTRAAELETQVHEVDAQLAEAVASLETLAERVAHHRTEAQGIERDWHSVEVARREVEVKRESLEERSLEEIGLDLNLEYLEYRAMMSEGDLTRINLDEAQQDIDELRKEVKKLGNVNLDSIEEETQLEERNEQLIQQVADIDTARQSLESLIERLNEVSKKRFGEAFEAIQGNFAGRDGMFRKLFGGGRAEVRLMGLVNEIDGEKVVTDEVDLLESGIEVIAKPPGKEPRSINQLSGGEKTLTAVALLLAIFRSKPSCFCILDEVDAALDEANVERYCHVVREFTSISHFIVITHNKKTMSAADRLYGVTMQERGVSKRVTVKFDEASKMVDGKPVKTKAKTDEPTPAEEIAEAEREEDAAPIDIVTTKPLPFRHALAGMRESHDD